MENEVWKDIPGYNGVYRISNLGNVWKNDYIGTDGKLHKGHSIEIRHNNFRTQYQGKTKILSLTPLMKELFDISDTNSLNGEIWKEIEGYDGQYHISNYGRVKSKEHYKIQGDIVYESILKERNGSVVLIKDGVHNTTQISALLYDYFGVGYIKDLDGEEWKDIDGFEGVYQISNYGRVKRIDHTTICKNGRKQRNLPKIITPVIDKHGYHRIHLDNKWYLVSRLVAIAFIPNPHNYPCVDHIDTDLNNNSSENLRWCTQKMNMNNPLTLQRLQSEYRKGMEVFVYKNNQFIGKYPSLNYLSKISLEKFGVKLDRSRIRKIINMETEYNGFQFKDHLC